MECHVVKGTTVRTCFLVKVRVCYERPGTRSLPRIFVPLLPPTSNNMPAHQTHRRFLHLVPSQPAAPISQPLQMAMAPPSPSTLMTSAPNTTTNSTGSKANRTPPVPAQARTTRSPPPPTEAQPKSKKIRRILRSKSRCRVHRVRPTRWTNL